MVSVTSAWKQGPCAMPVVASMPLGTSTLMRAPSK